jgi:hypothetical protein
MLEQGYLEPLQDFDYQGRTVLASRLGYRITDRFVHGVMGKIFDNPTTVFTEAILKPETQSLAAFVDGIENIVEAQQRVGQQYLDDGSVADACPPLQALLYIMATGEYAGKTVHDPAIRNMFTRDYLLTCDWYWERLRIKQQRDIQLYQRHVDYLRDFLERPAYADVVDNLGIKARLAQTERRLEQVQQRAYLESLVGTLGADPLKPYTPEIQHGREQPALALRQRSFGT